MNSMMLHNKLFCNIIAQLVNRPPVALSFEGAFTVCRYLNRKKRYYGVKFEEYMKTPSYVTPAPDGSYIKIDAEALLAHRSINYLDYIQSQGVKVTGIDLTRRDQYPFINFFHLVVLKDDLRLMHIVQDCGETFWEAHSTASMIQTVEQSVFETFKKIINQLESNLPLTLPFTLQDFAKSTTNRPEKKNVCKTIIERLEREGKTHLIPPPMSKISYVVTLTEEEKEKRRSGIKSMGKSSYKLLSEIESFHELDFKYYFGALIKSMTLYLISEVFPDQMLILDNEELTKDEATKLVNLLQTRIVSSYLDFYYPSGKQAIKGIVSIPPPKIVKISDAQRMLCEHFPSYDIATKENYSTVLSALRTNEERLMGKIESAQKVQKHYATNLVSKFHSKDALEMRFAQLPSETLTSYVLKMNEKLHNTRVMLRALNT
jgi:hypothetical protein